MYISVLHHCFYFINAFLIFTVITQVYWGTSRKSLEVSAATRTFGM